MKKTWRLDKCVLSIEETENNCIVIQITPLEVEAAEKKVCEAEKKINNVFSGTKKIPKRIEKVEQYFGQYHITLIHLEIVLRSPWEKWGEAEFGKLSKFKMQIEKSINKMSTVEQIFNRTKENRDDR